MSYQSRPLGKLENKSLSPKLIANESKIAKSIVDIIFVFKVNLLNY